MVRGSQYYLKKSKRKCSKEEYDQVHEYNTFQNDNDRDY